MFFTAFKNRFGKAFVSLLIVFSILGASIALPVKAEAVVVADDLLMWGTVALLSAWGISFIAKQASKQDFADSMRDLYDKAGILLDNVSANSAYIQSSGVLGIRPPLFDAARQLGDYLVTEVGSTTGSYEVTDSGISLLVNSSSSGYVQSTTMGFLDGVTLFPFQDLTLTFGSNTISVQFSGSSRVSAYQNGVLRGSSSGGNAFSDQALQHPRYLCLWRYSLTDPYFRWAKVYYYGGYWWASFFGDNIPASWLDSAPAPAYTVEANLQSVTVPETTAESSIYITAPALGYDNTTALEDTWYEYVTDQTIAYPETRTYPTAYEAQAAQAGAVDPGVVDPDLSPVAGLTEVFPFCIPFDVYHFLSLFSASREAPRFTLPLALPDYIGGTQELTVDLSSFDSVAAVLRTVELLAFCVGLAIETRKFIKW